MCDALTIAKYDLLVKTFSCIVRQNDYETYYVARKLV